MSSTINSSTPPGSTANRPASTAEAPTGTPRAATPAAAQGQQPVATRDTFEPAPTGAGAVTGASAAGTKGGITLDQLKTIMPHLPDAKAREYLPYLNQAMAEAGINTPKRQAAFLAQVAHESGEFRYMEELSSGKQYEGRKDLGNTQPGDGPRFKGRGVIQITGRNNYAAAGKALGVDLVSDPKRAASPDMAFRTAGWFWKTHGLNSLADAGKFDSITRRINGGLNGKADRDMFYQRALKVLGA